MDECDLAQRFPGFWLHVVLNLVYAVGTGLLVLGLWAAVLELREARAARFSGLDAAARYVRLRGTTAGLGAAVLVCGAVPIVVAAV